MRSHIHPRPCPGMNAFWLVVMLLAALAVIPPACCRTPKDYVEISWATNQHATRRAAIAAFEKENPGIKVKLRPISDSRQFFLQCLFGDTPDVITFFQVDAFQAFARKGLLKKLDQSRYKPWPFYPGLQDYCFRVSDHALMALPQVAYPYVLFFNQDLVNTRQVMELKTWQDLLKLVKGLIPRDAPNGKPIFGLDIQNELVWFVTWYWQRGGRLFERDTGKLVLRKSLVVDTLCNMAAWRSMEGLIPRPRDRVNLPSKGSSQGVLGNLFLQGRAIFFWSGSWKIYDFMTQHKIKWGVRSLPAGPRNGLTILGGNSFGVSSRSRHPREARLFVRYLVSKRGQMRHMAHHIYMPSRPDCLLPRRFRVLQDHIARARTLEYSPRINEVLLGDIIRQALEAHRLGRLDSLQAAEAMQTSLRSGSVIIEP